MELDPAFVWLSVAPPLIGMVTLLVAWLTSGCLDGRNTSRHMCSPNNLVVVHLKLQQMPLVMKVRMIRVIESKQHMALCAK